MEVNIRIAGEAGQGVQTTGELLVGAFTDVGLHVFSTQSYMSRIRGGLNSFDVRIFDREKALHLALTWAGQIPIGILYRSNRPGFESRTAVLEKDTLVNQYKGAAG